MEFEHENENKYNNYKNENISCHGKSKEYAFMEGGHKKLAFFGLNMTKT